MTHEPVQRVTGVDLPRLPATTIHDDAPAEGEEEYPAYKVRLQLFFFNLTYY